MCEILLSKINSLSKVGFKPALKIDGDELFNKVCEYYTYHSEESVLSDFENLLENIARSQSGVTSKFFIKHEIFDIKPFSFGKDFTFFLNDRTQYNNFIFAEVVDFLTKNIGGLDSIFKRDKTHIYQFIAFWYHSDNKNKKLTTKNNELSILLESEHLNCFAKSNYLTAYLTNNDILTIDNEKTTLQKWKEIFLKRKKEVDNLEKNIYFLLKT